MSIRRRYPAALPLLVIAVSYGTLLADEPPLITDRPDATESAHNVPRGLFQLEAGFAGGDLDRGESLGFLVAPATLLRIGLNDQFELRLAFAGLLFEERIPGGGGEVTERGTGNTGVGFKAAIAEEKGAVPQVAFIGGLALPTGDEYFRPERADPVFRFALSHSLGERFSVGTNLGMAWISTADEIGIEDTESYFDWTAVLGIGVSERVGCFVEFFGLAGASASAKPLNVFQIGATYLITPRLQVDATAAWGLSEIAPDWTAGVGISFRFPRFKG